MQCPLSATRTQFTTLRIKASPSDSNISYRMPHALLAEPNSRLAACRLMFCISRRGQEARRHDEGRFHNCIGTPPRWRLLAGGHTQ
jgi:hypothetical protein